MRKNYQETAVSPPIFALMLTLFLGVFVQFANAQTFYKSVSASQLDMVGVNSNLPAVKEIKSEGTFLVKDGSLDEIYSLKLTLQTPKLDSLFGDKKITFEKTRVMVLPIMGMVHVIGTLDVEGYKSTASFQLGFIVNNDQSVTFKGTKSFKLNEFAKDLPNDELTLAIDFVCRNQKNNLVALSTK